MLDLKDFFSELGKARKGVSQGCSATYRAAMTRVQTAIIGAINKTNGQLRSHADAAFAYVEGRRRNCQSVSDQIELLYAFWEGFNRGWRGAQASGPVDEHYDAGFDFGKEGKLLVHDFGGEITLDLELDLDDDDDDDSG
ncbi:MAG: hypothetical protein QY323_00930 [Patescibacteria group bacterium]|nr:MAG: hypothetical protein QY323_00930 [Patescibacteria group bacterium]